MIMIYLLSAFLFSRLFCLPVVLGFDPPTVAPRPGPLQQHRQQARALWAVPVDERGGQEPHHRAHAEGTNPDITNLLRLHGNRICISQFKCSNETKIFISLCHKYGNFL